MTHDPIIFDRRLVRLHRDRAAASFAKGDFFFHEAAERVAERLRDIKHQFPFALDLGSHRGLLAKYIKGLNGIEQLVHADVSPAMIAQADGLSVVADEELLPFAEKSFDLVLSVFSLHWINDLPGTLIQINRILKPRGLLIAMLPGGETLKELRASFEQAELAQMGGLSPHVSPFIDTRDGAGLLQRAGFTLPVADSDILNIHYEHPMHLLNDLRACGETNALITVSKSFLRRDVLAQAIDYYRLHFPAPNRRVNATCEIVTLTGWKKDG